MKNASSDQIRDAARRAGMKTLAEDGWRLVRRGITTVEEVLSVTTAKEVEQCDATVGAGIGRRAPVRKPLTFDARPST